MILITYILVFIASFCSTEFLAWFSHKYIMHGLLWKLHKDHHINTKGGLEHNDWFSIFFAIPSFLLIYLGLKFNIAFVVIIGAGMAAYGLAYFIVHDVFIHQRLALFRNTNNSYLKAIRRAHKIHHKQINRENAESFGFLIVSKKYFIENKNSMFER